MIGPSPVNIKELEIGDHVKVVSDDGSFEAKICRVTQEEGIVFEMLKIGTEYIIAFEDLVFYDFYPRGETIQKLAKKTFCSKGGGIVGKPNDSSGENNSKDYFRAIAQKEQKEQKPEITDVEIQFFKSFDQFRNTSLGDAHQAEMLLEEMQELAKGNKDLQAALDWVTDERVNLLVEAEML